MIARVARAFPRASLARYAPLRCAALVLLLSLTYCAAAAAPPPPDLLAHGSEQRIWLARVEKDPAKQDANVTTFFLREKFEQKWNRVAPFGSRVIGLGNKDSQLALLLASGDWRLTTDDDFASGRSLPGGARLLTFGSDAQVLWAVGLAPPAASRPGSRPVAAATMTTRAATSTSSSPTTNTTNTVAPTSLIPAGPARLVLYKLGPTGWLEQALLPDSIAADDQQLSLGFASGKPLVAHRIGERTVRIHRHVGGNQWQPLRDVEGAAAVQEFKLLGGVPAPTLWLRGAQGPPRLWIAVPAPSRSANATTTATPATTTPTSSALDPSAIQPVVRDLTEVGPDAPNTIAFANGSIRVLWIDSGKIFEQRRSVETGLPDGELSSLPLPAERIIPTFAFWTQVTLTIALVVALAASVRRRREMQDLEIDPEKFRLAPFTARFIAGIVDALPLLAGLWVAFFYLKDPTEQRVLQIVLSAVAAYLLLTTLVELAAGRSLGKMLTGLRVISLDGNPPSAGQRVMRNLLRLIDLPVMPLALILFSPLRQRAGDLAAGTVVVNARAAKQDDNNTSTDDKEPEAK